MKDIQIGILKAEREKPDENDFPAYLQSSLTAEGENLSLLVFSADIMVNNVAGKNREIVEEIRKTAREQAVWILAGSLYWIDENNNKRLRTFLINDGGEITGIYDGCHLSWNNDDRDPYLRGIKPLIFPYKGMLFSVTDESDLLHPEFFRVLALSGVEAVIVSCSTEDSFFENNEVLARARAIENSMYVIDCYGKIPDSIKRRNYDPLGNPLENLDSEGSLETVSLSPAFVRKTRKKSGVMSSRNTDVYHPLLHL